MRDWAAALAASARRSGSSPSSATTTGARTARQRQALEGAGIPVLDNDAGCSRRQGAALLARRPRRPARSQGGLAASTGFDDLGGTLAKIGDAALAILLAHEPDIFPRCRRGCRSPSPATPWRPVCLSVVGRCWWFRRATGGATLPAISSRTAAPHRRSGGPAIAEPGSVRRLPRSSSRSSAGRRRRLGMSP